MNILVLASLLMGLVGTALIGGLLFAFSICVMKALSSVPNEEGIRVMQKINRFILNPLFFAVFFGTTILSAANVIFMAIGLGGDWPSTFMLALAAYLIGTFLVTAVGNVPMNNRLDVLDPSEGAEYWRKYLKDWTRLNHLRSAASVISILMYGIGFIQVTINV